MDLPALPVDVVPLEAQQLPPPAAGHQQQVHRRAPLDGLGLQGLEDFRHLLHLEVVGVAGLPLGRAGPVGGV